MRRLRQISSNQIIIIFFIGVVFGILLIPYGCDKDEPTKSVSFDPPGIYTGTYYILRDWQDPDYEDTSLAYITITFKSDLTFTMTIDDVDTVTVESEFSPCSVNGTYVFSRDTLSFDVSNLHPDPSEICDPSVSPDGSFAYSVVQNTLVFISHGVDYRMFQLDGN